MADQDYHVSLIAKLRGGQFTSADVMSVTGGVVGTPSVSLANLNQSPNLYVLLELDFHTSGRTPTIPNNPHQASNYTIVSFDNTNITITMPLDAGVTIAPGQFVGTALSVTTSSRIYTVTGSTGLSGGNVTLTTDATNLITDGVIMSAKVFLNAPSPQQVSLQLISNSNATIDWDSIQIEARKFRTSMCYQQDSLEVRARSSLVYRRSPLRGATTFGVYGVLVEWRGDGIVFSSGNLTAYITNGIFYVQAGSVTIQSRAVVPSTNLSFFIQVASENAAFSLYINGTLEAKATVANFTIDTLSTLEFTSDGLRRIQRFFTTNAIKADGQIAVGAKAIQDVGALFSDAVLIDPVSISSNAPTFLLPPVTIPAPTPPIASSLITGLNTGTSTVTVASATGYVNGAAVAVLRNGRAVQYANITSISSNNIVLSTVSSIVVGDTLVYGNFTEPGRIASRFPFDPVDLELITAVDTNNKILTLTSSAAFTNQRAFVQTNLFQDVSEVLVLSTNPTNKTITLDSVAGISAGMYISQPQNELHINTANYFPSLFRSVDGVAISQKYLNGVVLTNTNQFPVSVRPYIRVYL